MVINIIENLINEQGSGVILKERRLLLKNQLVAYDNELSVCRKKISSLADIIWKLESENQNLKLENRILNEKIESFHSANPQGYRCIHCLLHYFPILRRQAYKLLLSIPGPMPK